MFTLSNGQKIPLIGMGTFGSDKNLPEEIAAAVSKALEIGYRLFDCASVYCNEDKIGEVFARTSVPREELFIMSKVWNDMHKKGEVLLSAAKSLKDLRLDYLDAYFVHWPFRNYHAPGCDGDARNPDSKPFDKEEFMETWRQMERLYDMGLVKNLGMSNMTIKKLNEVLPLCCVKPTLIEMELHPSFAQSELIDYCINSNIQPIAYSPLGSPNRPERDKAPGDVVDTLLPSVQSVAQRNGIHPVSVCLKWALQRGAIPIPFSVSEKNLSSNLSSVTSPPLSAQDMEELKSADCNCRLIKGQVFLWQEAESWLDLWD